MDEFIGFIYNKAESMFSMTNPKIHQLKKSQLFEILSSQKPENSFILEIISSITLSVFGKKNEPNKIFSQLPGLPIYLHERALIALGLLGNCQSIQPLEQLLLEKRNQLTNGVNQLFEIFHSWFDATENTPDVKKILAIADKYQCHWFLSKSKREFNRMFGESPEGFIKEIIHKLGVLYPGNDDIKTCLSPNTPRICIAISEALGLLGSGSKGEFLINEIKAEINKVKNSCVENLDISNRYYFLLDFFNQLIKQLTIDYPLLPSSTFYGPPVKPLEQSPPDNMFSNFWAQS
jgi:hypothetical protein